MLSKMFVTQRNTNLLRSYLPHKKKQKKKILISKTFSRISTEFILYTYQLNSKYG